MKNETKNYMKIFPNSKIELTKVFKLNQKLLNDGKSFEKSLHDFDQF